jgi:hypothetical protein
MSDQVRHRIERVNKHGTKNVYGEIDTYLHSRAARLCLAASMEEPPHTPGFSRVFMMQRSITWRTCLYVCQSDCDLLSEIKLLVGFHQIRSRVLYQHLWSWFEFYTNRLSESHIFLRKLENLFYVFEIFHILL